MTLSYFKKSIYEAQHLLNKIAMIHLNNKFKTDKQTSKIDN